ncbi:MAG: LexA family transcriptional regulator, partial [Clostridia bacterium]|nr:LexA family transcriptional regulator [Clostridia bacterium]
AIEDVVGYVSLDEDSSEGEEFFALRVRGSSMEPRFMEGDVVIVRRQDDAESGDVVVALNGDDATIKQLKKLPHGIMLVPFNREFEPLLFTRSDAENVRILGKVVELRAKL